MDPMERAAKVLGSSPGHKNMMGCSSSGVKVEPEIDGLLANAGYTVKASDLAHVAQRLEQLESIMGTVQDPGISHLASEAVHYNPSDLAGWIESMFGELNPGADMPVPFGDRGSLIDSSQFHKPIQDDPSLSAMDLALIQEYGLQFNGNQASNPQGFSPDSNPSVRCNIFSGLPLRSGDSTRHMNFQARSFSAQSSDEGSSLSSTRLGTAQQSIDNGAQESGIRVVHLLMGCAEAIQRNNLKVASDLVREIRMTVNSAPCGAMGKVASHFVEALARRICGLNGAESNMSQADAQSEILYHHFYEVCPYLKFAHFTANQAILEAFEGHGSVHVIDLNLMHGLQWPALIQALALRPGGPPFLRLTAIGPRQPDGRDVLQEIGMKLAQFAESVNVEFDFRGVMADKLEDIKPWMFQVKPGEVVAVNSVLQLHRLLYIDAPTGSSPIDVVLKSIGSLRPKIVTVVEHEANHNGPVFLDRFVEALHYYSTMFDSLEACNVLPNSMEKLLAELYIQKEICNIVACEGRYRIERHETLSHWRVRLGRAGFRPSHLGSNAFKQARMLLTLFSGEGYTVEENNGSLTLGWHSRPLIAASAWQGS